MGLKSGIYIFWCNVLVIVCEMLLMISEQFILLITNKELQIIFPNLYLLNFLNILENKSTQWSAYSSTFSNLIAYKYVRPGSTIVQFCNEVRGQIANFSVS